AYDAAATSKNARVIWRIEYEKSLVYYVAHGFALTGLLGAGGIAALRAIRRHMAPNGFLVAFVLFQLACILMTVRGFELKDVLSTRIVGAAGPLTSVLSIVMFIGMDARNWRVLPRVFLALAVLST